MDLSCPLDIKARIGRMEPTALLFGVYFEFAIEAKC